MIDFVFAQRWKVFASRSSCHRAYNLLGFLFCTFRKTTSHRWSMGFKSGLWASQSRTPKPECSKKAHTFSLDVWSSLNILFIISATLSTIIHLFEPGFFLYFMYTYGLFWEKLYCNSYNTMWLNNNLRRKVEAVVKRDVYIVVLVQSDGKRVYCGCLLRCCGKTVVLGPRNDMRGVKQRDSSLPQLATTARYHSSLPQLATTAPAQKTVVLGPRSDMRGVKQRDSSLPQLPHNRATSTAYPIIAPAAPKCKELSLIAMRTVQKLKQITQWTQVEQHEEGLIWRRLSRGSLDIRLQRKLPFTGRLALNFRKWCSTETEKSFFVEIRIDDNDPDVSTSCAENWSCPYLNAGVNSYTAAMHANSSFIVKPWSATIWFLVWCGTLVGNSLFLTSSMSLSRRPPPPQALERKFIAPRGLHDTN